MIDYHWRSIQFPRIGKPLDHYINSFLKIADDHGYAHYIGKADAMKKIRDYPNDEFPHHILLEADYYTLDEYSDILWKTLGPAHGECHKEYQRLGDEQNANWICPDVAVDHDYYLNMWNSYQHHEFWKQRYDTFEAFFEHMDEGPVAFDHSHTGDWQQVWLAKTGYDYGVQLYRFRRQCDLVDFSLKISLGPQFETMEK